MTQKTALILSAILTAFVLVLGGGVIARVSQADAVSAQAAAAPATAVPAPTAATQAADVMAQAQALLQQRDAEYRQLIDQANQRLAAMNQQQAALQAAQAAQAAASQAAPQPAARSAPPAAAPAPAAAPQFTVSPESALSIALQAANNATLIRNPELVRFEGKVAYEVVFTRGAVYVDANTGAVLYNGTQGHGGGGQSAPSTQPPASGGEHDHEGEHESGNDG